MQAPSSSIAPIYCAATDDDQKWKSELTPDELQALRQLKERSLKVNGREAFDDRYLMKFVFARKLDVERAEKLMHNHFEFVTKYNYNSLDMAVVSEIATAGYTQWVPGTRDKGNRGIVYIFPRNFDVSKLKHRMTMRDQMQYSLWMGKLSSAENINNDREGYIYIEDFSGASFSEITKMMNGSEMGEMFKAMQEQLPIRLRGILIVNAPWYVRILITMVKPFMKKKMVERVALHTYESLREEVGAENLLEQVGGHVKFDYQQWLAANLQQQNKQ